MKSIFSPTKYFYLLLPVYAMCVNPCLAQAAETEGAQAHETTDESSDDLEEWGESDDTCWLDECDGVAGPGPGSGRKKRSQYDIDFDQLADQSGSYSLRGFVSAQIAYSYLEPVSGYPFNRSEAEISKTQTNLHLAYEQKIADEWKLKASANAFYDFYYQRKGKYRFPEETLDAYEQEVELRDTYIEGPVFDKFWIKFGRQTIAWGEADFSQVLSLANPVDIRELGRTDIIDALVPVTASKLVYNYEGWELNAVAIHEIRANKIATYGAEMDFYASARGPYIAIEDDDLPDSNASNTEKLFRAFKPFAHGDISFVYADVISNTPHLEYRNFQPDTGITVFQPEYKRIKALGFSGNYVVGPWLFKTELARKTGTAVPRNDLQQQLLSTGAVAPASVTEKDIYEAVVGFTYAGPENLTLSLESFLSSIHGHTENLVIEKNSWTHSLMVTKDLLRDRLHIQFLVTHIPLKDEHSQIIRLGVDYDYTDDLVFTLGGIFYEASGEGAPLYPYSRNDNIFAAIKFSF